MERHPMIPDEFLSELNEFDNHRLDTVRELSESRSSNLQKATSSHDFLKKQQELIQHQLAYIEQRSGIIKKLEELGKLTDAETQDKLRTLFEDARPLRYEYNILLRQKKSLTEDVNDIRRHHNDDFQKAYAEVIGSRLSMAKYEPHSCNRYSGFFRSKVLMYYKALKRRMGEKVAYCHITGTFYPQERVQAVHLVPNNLDSEAVAHLFGVGEVPLSDPRNGITLHETLAEGLIKGRIVIVPVQPPFPEQPVDWKCLLIDRSWATRELKKGLPWEYVNGRSLTFLSDHHRPACRFVYFKYFMTYLQHRRAGNLDFVNDVDSGISTAQFAGQGQHFRRGTLNRIAATITNFHLGPAHFFNQMTFEDSYYAAHRRLGGDYGPLASKLALQMMKLMDDYAQGSMGSEEGWREDADRDDLEQEEST